jgi:hypothetical protein
MFSSALQAVTYKWIDEEGNTIYSDTPRAGAEEIKEREVQTYSAPPLPKPPVESQQQTRQAPEYTSVAIASPENDAVIIENNDSISVSIQVSPPLSYAYGHKMVLKVDGTPYAEPGTATSFTLEGLYRGSHQLQAEIVDKQGKHLISSSPVTIHVKRHFIKP